MSKSRQQPARPGGGLSSLRPRLDALLRDPAVETADVAHLSASLDALTATLKPAAFLPIVLAASQDAPPAARAALDATMPDWLHAHGYERVLHDLLAREQVPEALRATALAWLAHTGAEVDDLLLDQVWDPFFDAYTVGNEMQSSVGIFFYTGRRQRRAIGLSLLIDNEPPWDGALKDCANVGQRAPRQLLDSYLNIWRSRGSEPVRISAEEAKRMLLVALECNQKAGIRLHGDLASEREFWLCILALPDTPQTPRLGIEVFDEMARTGRRSEEIQREEQIMGYQTRMPDGTVIRLIRPPDDADW